MHNSPLATLADNSRVPSGQPEVHANTSVVVWHADVLRYRIVPWSRDRDAVGPSHQKSPVVAEPSRGDVVVDAVHVDGGVGDSLALLVGDESLDSHVHLLHVGEESRLIVSPFLSQLGTMGVLATRQLHRDLKAVAVQVVVVLHPSWDIIPVSSIGDSAWKVISSTNIAFMHCTMIVSVSVGQETENFIIWRWTVLP